MWNDHKINAMLAWMILILVLLSFIVVTIMLLQSPRSSSFGTVLMRYLPLGFWTIVGVQLARCSMNHVTTYECEDCGALMLTPDLSHRQHGDVVPMH